MTSSTNKKVAYNGNPNLKQIGTVISYTPEQVQELFDFWVLTHEKQRPVLNDTRRQLLAVAIYDYGIDYCRQAVEGCLNSQFHMGQNKRGKVYNSLELIFRDAATVERFASYMDGGR